MRSPKLITEPALRRTLVHLCHTLYERGLLVALDGNLSVRLGDDAVLCTAGGTHKGRITEDDLVVTSLDGQWLRGLGTATSEIHLHLACYRNRPDVQAVVHAHPPHAIAAMLAGISMLPPYLPETVLNLGPIPTLPYIRTGTMALAEQVGEAAIRHDAMLLDRHGVVTVGQSLELACDHLEAVEHLAKILLIAGQRTHVQPLDAKEAASLRRIGLERYGGPPVVVAEAGITRNSR